MRRLGNNEPCSLGREIVLRMTQPVAKALFAHMQRDPHREQMAFALGRQAKTALGTVFVIKETIFPEPQDLQEQSAAGVCPKREFQSYVYRAAYASQSTIVEFHTHPGSFTPRFSGIDEAHAQPNAAYISDKLPEPITLLMIVGNNRFDAFDGVVYDRHRHQFRQVDRLEVHGRPTKVWLLGERQSQPPREDTGLFERQKRIPGWNQHLLELLRIGVFGAGGNGAPLLQTLLGIGAGRQGFLAIADPDILEPSNLPRIPYGYACHLHTPKVAAATQYAGNKSPTTPLYAFPCRFEEEAVWDRMKMANVLFYCGDTDGGRRETNAFAVRYGIPLIDLGCDVQVADEHVVAGGQVRIVLPGENACLVCCGGFDPSQAAFDQMTDVARARHASQGYVVGADAQATPSVANLNGLAAQYAISQFLAVVNGENFTQWDYLHFDQLSGRTIPARTTPHDACPLCGPSGCLMEGDPAPAIDSPASSTALLARGPLNHAESANQDAAEHKSDYSLPAPWFPDGSTP
jgi:molybdopterin/thiamine biosynthesis adenylyltransferase